ncbi:hypothetical protein ACIRL2_33320 [Embleya sp. NPDC127516]|uniref:hypothetical protein n=1 Tax=Embleya sp. NPDC127516 TaxID=3363990 RepID=UPI00381BCE26
MRYLAFLFGGIAGAASACYAVVYLYRWEWNRAVFCLLIFVIVEILVVAAVLLGRIARLERHLGEADERTEEARRRLEQARDETGTGRFRWLDAERMDSRDTHHVFVPVLLAAGVVLSGVAWVIQRIARLTSHPVSSGMLARRLVALNAPADDQALGVEPQLEDRPAVAPARRVRAVAVVAGAVLAAVLLALAVDRLADATESRSEGPPESVASTVVFRVISREEREIAREVAARELWEGCRSSTGARPEYALLGRLDTDVWVGVVRPALNDHDMMRLRGCLQDTRAFHARAEIVGEGQAPPRP